MNSNSKIIFLLIKGKVDIASLDCTTEIPGVNETEPLNVNDL